MLTLIVVLVILLVLFFFGIIAHSSTRLSFLEKEAEVIDFIAVTDESDGTEMISGYKPVVKFEVEGKFYQGTAHVFPLWHNKTNKSLIILYNPKNPAEFQAKEPSNN